ncbi:Na+/H+ antiporter subunit G [Macrococcus hajekii]|uniref:Na+/H+ antiporter subunit G n=1 Tax=Macrococcus hajekii TaxID=198482 RepID=A0A4R6BNN8_9STAP|nr:monovalent cation/H(+) antiporter subunit G [Macrococcus hajekii]TDM03476.1 Na+/H+ antiporter subunit G [Macrococcus hajekii]GGA99176.1 Na(+)/H(+) antiporter subunit G [Macrococcus hajekii]
MSAMIFNGLAMIFISVGSLFSLVSAIGLFRLPDVYTRAHAASKAATLGVMFILLGVMFFFIGKDHVFNPSLLLAVLFIFMTGPIGGHLITRSAYHNGVKYTDSTIRDDLKNTE